MNRIAVVIVTYNRRSLLLRCLEALKKQTVQTFDIIIIDNASSDGTGEMIHNLKRKENIIYYNTGKNLGGAGGFHYGIKMAAEKGYDYLWIMDDDTLPKETALEKFLKKNSELNKDYGFLSGKALWKDGTICIMNRQKKTKWRYLKNFDNDARVQYASFVSLFIPVRVIEEAGLPMKEFFIWADDWEYTRRISKHKKCYFVSDSEVIHFCDNNVGADIVNASNDRLERFAYMYRNDVYMYRNDGIDGYIYLGIRFLLHIIRILTKAADKKRKIKLMCDSMKRGFSFRPKIKYINR